MALAGFAACLAANLPGHFSPDSVWQLAQGRTGVYDDWHPPVMAWMLGLADRLSPQAALFAGFDAALFFGGLLALVGLERRPSPWSLLALGLIAASPIVLVYQGIVWKDVLFADAALAGFAALTWSTRFHQRPRLRWTLAGLALCLLALACLARQNGAVAPICGLGALLVDDWLAGLRRQPRMRAFAAAALRAAGAAIFVGLVVGLASWGLALRGNHAPQSARQLERIQLYDLAGVLNADPSLRLAILRRDAPALETFLRRGAAPAWREASGDNLIELPGARALFGSSGEAVRRQWLTMIGERPLLYLRERARVFEAVLLTPSRDVCPMVFAGVDSANPRLLAQAGLSLRFDARDRWDDTYEFGFLGTPVFSHLFYGAIAAILGGWAVVDLRAGRRPGEMITIIAMLTYALITTASFFLISTACDYRYLYFLDVAAMAALAHRAAKLGPASRRPAAGETEPA